MCCVFELCNVFFFWGGGAYCVFTYDVLLRCYAGYVVFLSCAPLSRLSEGVCHTNTYFSVAATVLCYYVVSCFWVVLLSLLSEGVCHTNTLAAPPPPLLPALITFVLFCVMYCVLCVVLLCVVCCVGNVVFKFCSSLSPVGGCVVHYFYCGRLCCVVMFCCVF